MKSKSNQLEEGNSQKSNETILKAIAGSKDTPLILGEIELECYVLEDGTRVFSGKVYKKPLVSLKHLEGQL